jgi:hypothetical protein
MENPKWKIQMDNPKIDPLDVAKKSRVFPHLLLFFLLTGA